MLILQAIWRGRLYFPASGETMIAGIGIDIVEIARFEAEKVSPHFLERVFTPTEIAEVAGSARKLAERFALKEAVMKALSAGIQQGVWFTQIETRAAKNGTLKVTLSGKATKIRAQLGVKEIFASVAGSRTMAVAFAVCVND